MRTSLVLLTFVVIYTCLIWFVLMPQNMNLLEGRVNRVHFCRARGS